MDGSIRNQDGFTLLELLVTVTLMSIILMASVPGFSDLLSRHHVSSTKSELKKAVHLARSEAIMRGETVFLCLTRDGISCIQTQGKQLMVFTDPDYQGGRSSKSHTLFKYSWSKRNVEVSYNRALLKFTPRGYASGTNGTITICSRLDTQNDGLIISTLGRVRSARDYNKDGIKDKSPGTPLACS